MKKITSLVGIYPVPVLRLHYLRRPCVHPAVLEEPSADCRRGLVVNILGLGDQLQIDQISYTGTSKLRDSVWLLGYLERNRHQRNWPWLRKVERRLQ